MRVVHAADIHLDSPLRGLTRLGDKEIATQLRQASRHALRNLVRLVVDTRADALVLAGDIYDGDWADYATGRFFVEQMQVLDDEKVPVFLAAGNHDAESQITKTLTLPPNVSVLSTDHPETVIKEQLGLAVHGQGFPTRAVAENLVPAYPARRPGYVNVGILHTAVNGADGHANYAPCTPEDLVRTEYDYFALGHVHRHRIVNDGHRVAAFSGNLQGRHPRETGVKGALVVDVQPDERAEVRLEPLDVARWARIRVDVTDVRSVDDAMERADIELAGARVAAEDRLLVAQVVLAGRTPVAAALTDRVRLQEEMAQVAARRGVTLERVMSEATTHDARDVVDRELLSAVCRAGDALAADTPRLRELTRSLDSEIGRQLRAGNGLDLHDEAALRRLSRDAVAELTTILSSGEY